MINCFSVIRVNQSYDYVEGAECVASFLTEQEANSFIQKMKDEAAVLWKKREEYIDEFVDSINLPETDYKGWVEFLKQFHPFGCMYVFPKDFKQEMKVYLRNHLVKLEGYNPPAYHHLALVESLFVVEIKPIKAT